MTMSQSERYRLLKACKKLGSGRDCRCDDYVENLMLTVLDFRLDTFKVVNPAIKYFQEKHGHLGGQALKNILARYPNTESGNRRLALDLWGYRFGARAKFLREIIRVFGRKKIAGQKSLVRWLARANFEDDVKGQFRTAYHSIGIVLFNWLRVRCGFPTVKADIHVLSFVREAIGRKLSVQDATDGLEWVAKRTRRKPHLLDSAIWHYQHDR